MNYLLIANNDFDGVGQTAVNLCKTIISKGYKSKLIVLNKSSNKIFVQKIKRSIILRVLLFFKNSSKLS